MKSTSENELLRRLARGDGDALKVLFERHFSTLSAIGTRLCGDADDGKDVAQKVFIALWEKRARLEIEGPIEPYLKRMAINEALGRQRTANRRREIRDEIYPETGTAPTGEEQVIADETRAKIRNAIDGLPEKTRDVFILSRNEEMSYKEISKTLEISVKTVEYHMGKALLELRKRIIG